MRSPSLFLALVTLSSVLGVQIPRVRSSLFLHHGPPPPPPPSDDSISSHLILPRFITQRLDHFNDSNTATWEMRYFSNDQHYAPGGPLFVLLGGEGEIYSVNVLGGHLYDMAKEMKGYLFCAEHRYYGQSRPTSDMSLANLKYLTVDQTLADFAHFVDYQRANVNGAKNSKVIVVGASYAGAMAAWFRQKYPDKANGAWASSAPVHAQLDFHGYNEVMSEAYAYFGPPGCSDLIRAAFQQLQRDFQSGQVAHIKDKFKLCEEIKPENHLDVRDFFSGISNKLMDQYWPELVVNETCAALMEAHIGDPVEALAKFIRKKVVTNCICYSYEKYIKVIKKIEFGDLMIRQWTYQTCNEFGWFQTSTSNSSIFGDTVPLDYNINMCKDIFGDQFTHPVMEEKIAQTNRNHKGYNINVTNVVFTHGQWDPWRLMGVQKDLNAESPVIILEKEGHCSDLGSISDEDSKYLRAAKERISQEIRKWLGL